MNPYMPKIAILLCVLALSCSPYYKYYKFEMQPDCITKSITLAPLNLLDEKPKELIGMDSIFSSMIDNYLKTNEKQTISNEAFKSLWILKLSEMEGIYNKHTGQFLADSLQSLISKSVSAFCKMKNVDAVLFPSIVPRKAILSGPYGYWDGIQRKLIIEKPIENPNDFSWTGDAKGVSLKIIIYDKNGKPIFKSFGGIEMATKIKYFGTLPKAVSNDSLFSNSLQLKESIQIALHPFIIYADYPKHPKFESCEADSINGIIVTPIQNSTNIKEMKKWDGF
jgi:hypothetical protein